MAIPAFYRLYFHWSDPAICLWGAYMDFFTPAFVSNAFLPKEQQPWNPMFNFTLQQLGGALLMLAVIDILLLRYTEDVGVWKILQAAVLVYDLSLLYSNYDALGMQGRLSLEGLRWEDWGGIFISAQAAVVRTAFLLGVGLGKEEKGGKKRS